MEEYKFHYTLSLFGDTVEEGKTDFLEDVIMLSLYLYDDEDFIDPITKWEEDEYPDGEYDDGRIMVELI